MTGAALTYVDRLLAVVLPELFRIGLWAAVCGFASMWLYAVVSPQKRLRELRDRAAALQKRLSSYDGDLAGATKLMRQNLAIAFQRLGLALVPSLLAGVPVIVVILWMADSYSAHQSEPGDSVSVSATAPGTSVHGTPAVSKTDVNEIQLDRPAREILHFGPMWMRTWLFPFVAVSMCSALCAKYALRIS